MEHLRVVNNHPVHIFNENNTLSPTAFIPFCLFGGDMKVVGIKSEKFDVPVCNRSFLQRRHLVSRNTFLPSGITIRS